jgi:hypothetical protein
MSIVAARSISPLGRSSDVALARNNSSSYWTGSRIELRHLYILISSSKLLLFAQNVDIVKMSKRIEMKAVSAPQSIFKAQGFMNDFASDWNSVCVWNPDTVLPRLQRWTYAMNYYIPISAASSVALAASEWNSSYNATTAPACIIGCNKVITNSLMNNIRIVFTYPHYAILYLCVILTSISLALHNV